MSLAHWADTGGAAPGSYVSNAVDAWQEGLRIAPFRVFTRDGVDREKLDFILANVRGPEEREGDILAQMAATRMADQHFCKLIKDYGVETVQQAIRQLHDRAEIQMREAITAIPDGVYEGEDFLDDDAAGGKPVGIRVRVEIKADQACFDFSSSDDAAIGPVNTTPFYHCGFCFLCHENPIWSGYSTQWWLLPAN